MSKTNLQIIEGALRKIMLLDENETATIDQANTGLDFLNQMMAMWNETAYSLNFPPQDTLADTCPIPAFAEMAVISNLAVNIAPSLEMEVPQSVETQADRQLKYIKNILLNQKLKTADTSNLPRGAGNSIYYDITTSAGTIY